jgi:hypothetical protein
MTSATPTVSTATSLAVNSPTSTAKATLSTGNRGPCNSVPSAITRMTRRRSASTAKPVRALPSGSNHYNDVDKDDIIWYSGTDSKDETPPPL